MTDSSPSSPPPPPKTTERKGHPRWALALVVLGTILTFAAIFSIWVNRQALNTDNWVDTSTRLIQNEEVRDQLANYLATQLFAHADVSGELEEALPPRLAPLASAAAGGLEQLAPQVAERLFATPKFQELWEAANRKAHESLLKVLNGGSSAVSTENGEVKLQLEPVLEEIGEGSGLGEALVSKLPPEAGEITILKSNELSLAQEVAKILRKLPIALTLAALLCFGFAVFLSPRRRETLRAVGLAFMIAGLLSLGLRGFAGTYVVGGLSKTTSVEPAVEAVWSISTSELVTIATSAFVFGLLVVIAAVLAGPSKAAASIRRYAAPYARRSPASLWGVALLIFLALIAWAPVAAFHKPLGVLVFALLFAAGTELYRRQLLEEAPGQGG
ncbi:MAG TPA: hypothetical protein VMT37_02890 [Solirubrobacterales bacterium]|nr:hypothetical protein [Solirubrobacterales bacterium]